MKFKNKTGENVKYRLGSVKSGFTWLTIRRDEIAEIPEHIGDKLKLTKIKEISEENDNESSEEDSTNVETGLKEDQEEAKIYKKKLIDIDGVGKRTAKKIIAKYPTEEKLREAIDNGEEIHKRDDIDYAVKEIFQ